MAGKWHLGNTIDRSPWARGFDRSFALLPAGASHYGTRGGGGFSAVPTLFTEDDQFVTVGDDFYSSDASTDTLLRYLRERPRARRTARSSPTCPSRRRTGRCRRRDETIADYHGRYDAGPDALREERLAALNTTGPVPTRCRAAPGGGRRRPEWADMTAEERAAVGPHHGGLRRHGGPDGLEHRPGDRLPRRAPASSTTRS